MPKELNLLSESICDSAESCGRKVRKLHDGGGLYLWICEDSRKLLRLRYWLSGKEKSLSLGAYPDISISEARALRDKIREQLKSGLDPSEQRKFVHREAMKSAHYRNQFRLALSNDGALTIEIPSRALNLTRPQTDALRAFLLAAHQE
ncbi:MAG: Arm DNA-binding domain-containing protein [Gallionellaceae bacterium]